MKYVGFLVYFAQYDISITWLVNVGLLGLMAENYTSIYVGYVSDKLISKHGRRLPFVISGFFMRAVSFLLLTVPPNSDDKKSLIIWFAVFKTTSAFGKGAYNNSFSAMLIENSANEADYMKFMSVTAPIASFLGGVTGLAVTATLPLLSAMIILIGGSISAFFLVKYSRFKETRPPEKQPDLIPSIRTACRSNEFRVIFINNVLLGSAIGIFANAAAFLNLIGFDVIEKQSEYVLYSILTTVATAITGIGIMISFNYFVGEGKSEKITVYQRVCLYASLLGVIVFFCSFTSFYAFFILTILILIVTFPFNLLSTLLIRDLLNYDVFITG